MIITRKIELWVLGDTKEQKNEAWNYLRSLGRDVCKAYNLVTSNQYFNEIFTERIRKTDEELSDKDEKLDKDIKELTVKMKDCKDKDEKKKLSDKRKELYRAQNMLNKAARKKAEAMYLTSEQNSTYQLLNKHFPDMPSAVKSVLNMDAVQAFKNDIFDVKMGKKTIRTYRDDMPIPFDKTSMRFFTDDEHIGIKWLDGISFLLHFGRDKSNNREIVQRAMNGIYKYSNSKIQIKDNKIFLLFCVDIPEEKQKLNADLRVGVNLGIKVPAYCALSEGYARLSIGSMDDLFRVRRQMQERRKRMQKQLTMARGGHGRKKKLKGLDHIAEKERNFVRTYNHMVSSQIIQFALKHGAGTIVMELLEGYGDDERNQLILRNWSYYELHQMVEYKAKKYGMTVKYGDPYRISQTCNVCKKYDEANLEDRDSFVCKNPLCGNHGKKVFSDYNAALNNAMTDKFVTSKEECEFHKKRELQEG